MVAFVAVRFTPSTLAVVCADSFGCCTTVAACVELAVAHNPKPNTAEASIRRAVVLLIDLHSSQQLTIANICPDGIKIPELQLNINIMVALLRKL